MTVHPPERQKNLQYVCEMLEQLKVVAGAQHGSVLGYLIDMARLEAEHQMMLLKEPSKD